MPQSAACTSDYQNVSPYNDTVIFIAQSDAMKGKYSARHPDGRIRIMGIISQVNDIILQISPFLLLSLPPSLSLSLSLSSLSRLSHTLSSFSQSLSFWSD